MATPHEVDIPITNLDDNDDDIVFAEPSPVRNSQFRISTDPSVLADEGAWLAEFDEEEERAGNNNNMGHTTPSRFTKALGAMKSILPGRLLLLSNNNNIINNRRTNEYEMVARGTMSDLTNDRDPSIDENLQEYYNAGSKRMKRILTRTVFSAAIGIVLVVLVLKWNQNRLVEKQQQQQYKVASHIPFSNGTHEFRPTTLVISLDGFHPHYINKRSTPALHRMLVSGYGAPYMRPSFPSSTFPNHWTLITGLYPSEHGIVGNTFYDPLLGRQFVNVDATKGALDPDFWQGGEPLWKTLARQNLSTAVHMWPGSEVRHGIGPQHDYDKFNGSESLSAKADRIMEWLDRPDLVLRPELILSYVPTIDQFGHKYGISGPELKEALTTVDQFIDTVQKSLADRNLTHVVNLMVLSDHGMAPTSPQRLLFIDDLLDMSKIEHLDGWPLSGIRPGPDITAEEVHQQLLTKMSISDREHFSIYRLQDFPEEYQFGGPIDAHRFNYRLAPLWIVPQVGYSITTHAKIKLNGGDYRPHGVHGYNNSEVTMRALFLGTGPFFESRLDAGVKVKPFDNVQVYNIVCDSVGAVPAPNNGTFLVGDEKLSVISHQNALPGDWIDTRGYPDLPFEVDHIVLDATYDLLWGPQPPDDKDVPSRLPLTPATLDATKSSALLATLGETESSRPKSGKEGEEKGKEKGKEKGDEGEKEEEEGVLHEIADDIELAIDDIQEAWEDSGTKSWLHNHVLSASHWLGGIFDKIRGKTEKPPSS